MIQIHYFRNGNDHRLSVQGHAGYDGHGRDIVCAAVSAISFALLGWLNHAGCDISAAKAEPGDMTIVCRGGEKVQTAFDMAVVGYLQIEKQYPHYINVHIAGDGVREKGA